MEPSTEQLAWEQKCSHALTSDLIWKLDAYRSAMFALHLSRGDVRTIRLRRPQDKIADQLATAAASISANLGEGYSRSTRTDRLRFLDYALGSARECVSWYEAAREMLGDAVVDQRLEILMRTRALLLGLLRSNRERAGTKRFER